MNEAKGILVIGGSGFVAQALIPRLPPPVYIISRRKLHHLPDGAIAFQCSLDNDDVLRNILPHCRWLIHLASDTTPGVSSLRPTFEGKHNLSPNLRLFELLQDFPNVDLIYLSSGGAVYGNPAQNPVHESSKLTPLSYYAAGKIAMEAFISALVQQSPRRALVLRPSNFYGSGQYYRPGFGIIPTILEYQRLGKPLQIWGDGENVRDYLFIDDFVDLCLLLLQHKADAPSFFTHTYNVGSGTGYSLNQLCNTLETITENPIYREYAPSRVIDVNQITLDVSRIENDYSWKAHTSLQDGLEQTWKWYRSIDPGH